MGLFNSQDREHGNNEATEQRPDTELANGAVHENGFLLSEIPEDETGSQLYNDVPAFTPTRKIKVVTIGAGFSGLLFAHKLQHQYPEMQDMVEHKIIESRKEIGGTWLVNTYPGIQCDVPAHIYVSSCSNIARS